MTTVLRTLFTLAAIIFCGTVANADNARVLEDYGKIPLAFTTNGGQLDTQVKFTTTGGGCTMYFTPSGTTFLLSKKTDAATESFAAKLLFAGANPNPVVSGEEALPWKTNYFSGDKSQWRTGVTNYGKVRLSGVYDGIDLVYYGNRKNIEYDFVVAPGKNPTQIALKYDLGAEGANSLSVNDAGELVVKTPLGNLVERTPYCYQVINGEKVEVAGAYTITDAAANAFGFALGAYDARYELCIDPVLVYSRFVGGTSGDTSGYLIAADASGCAYITGNTPSTDFPTTGGAYDTALQGTTDVYVTKLSANGTSLEYSTFLGGASDDFAYAVAVDDSGNAYVTGYNSRQGFPVTVCAYDTTAGGGDDIFVTKLSPDGASLVYSTYFGGSSNDWSYDIAVDGSGNAYVTGYTYSNNYPRTAAAFDTSFGGSTDAFVTVLNPSASALVYSTYLGGTGDDYGYGIVADDAGNAYVAGYTPSLNFPVTTGAFQTVYGGGSYDVFVTKLNPSGSDLVYSTYLGGSNNDQGYMIAMDGSGSAYVTGMTASSDFPVASAMHSTSEGSYDSFVTKLNPSGSALAYSTYLGGGSYAIAVDTSGCAYTAGYVSSPNLPVTYAAYDTSYNGGSDAYVMKLSADGSSVAYSTYIGGAGDEYANGIAVDASGSVYIVGQAGDDGYPVTTGSYNGGTDVFVTKLNLTPQTLTVTAPNGEESWTAGSSETLTWTSTGAVDSVRIELFTASGATFDRTITISAPNTGSYAWAIPSGLATGSAYRVKITSTSDSTVSDTSDADFAISPLLSVDGVPAAFAVSPAYPNPFNPSTAIGVQLPEAANVRAVMYNSLGQEVRVLHDGLLGAGSHTLVWDGRNASGTIAASGVYFYSVRAGEHSAKGKVMFLR